MSAGREHARRQLVVNAGLHVTLTAAAAAAKQRGMRNDDVDRIIGEPGIIGERRPLGKGCTEQPHHVRDTAGVIQGVLGGLVQQHLRGAHRVPVGQERQRRDLRVLPAAGAQCQRAAGLRSFRRPEQAQPELAQHRPVDRVEQVLVVVVSCDRHDLAAIFGQRQQGAHHQPLRPRARRGAVEQVPGDQDNVRVFTAGGRHDVAQRGGVLVMPVPALEDLADMPVGGVQNLHAIPSLPLRRVLRSPLRRPAGLRTAAGHHRRPGWWRTDRRAPPARGRGRPRRPSRSAGSPRRGTGNRPQAAPGCRAGR